jgi:hypothetical protein
MVLSDQTETIDYLAELKNDGLDVSGLTQNALDKRVYDTINQKTDTPLSIRNLYNMGYMTIADVLNPLGLIKEPVTISGININKTIDWCMEQDSNTLKQIGSQLKLFYHGRYDHNGYNGPLDMPVTHVMKKEIAIATSRLGDEHFKMKAYLFLVADYVAFQGKHMNIVQRVEV